MLLTNLIQSEHFPQFIKNLLYYECVKQTVLPLKSNMLPFQLGLQITISLTIDTFPDYIVDHLTIGSRKCQKMVKNVHQKFLKPKVTHASCLFCQNKAPKINFLSIGERKATNPHHLEAGLKEHLVFFLSKLSTANYFSGV